MEKNRWSKVFSGKNLHFGKKLVGPKKIDEKIGDFRKKIAGGYQMMPETNFRVPQIFA